MFLKEHRKNEQQQPKIRELKVGGRKTGSNQSAGSGRDFAIASFAHHTSPKRQGSSVPWDNAGMTVAIRLRRCLLSYETAFSTRRIVSDTPRYPARPKIPRPSATRHRLRPQ